MPAGVASRGGGAADTLNSTMTMLAALDYGSVKSSMIGGGDEAPALMQALRWRLTKPSRRQRKTALVQYIQNELLEGAVEPHVLGALVGTEGPLLLRRLGVALAQQLELPLERRRALGAVGVAGALALERRLQ